MDANTKAKHNIAAIIHLIGGARAAPHLAGFRARTIAFFRRLRGENVIAIDEGFVRHMESQLHYCDERTRQIVLENLKDGDVYEATDILLRHIHESL